MDQNPFPTQPAPGSGNVGPLAAAVIIVLLLAAGGFYFFYEQQQKQAAAEEQLNAAQGAETATASDESVDAMQADLDATGTSGADADVTDLNNAL
ncbi:MAG: hypothetical protein JWL87_636 [Candidatus Adlerbacteria bacterium]|nr:hypothetical protein [Candidatus Adlerbacteria bacterium]